MIPTLSRATQRAAVRYYRWCGKRMERLLQILDDLDDLYYMLGLLNERIRNIGLSLLSTGIALAALCGGIFLALIHPPVALATAIILFVSLLYRLVTSPRLEIA